MIIIYKKPLKIILLLKPRGRLIIEVPDYNTILAKETKAVWQGWHSPRHLTLFKEGFRQLFTPDKWSIVKHTRYGTLDAFMVAWKKWRKNIDWSSSMEGRFWHLVFLKIISFPFFL
jgi:predicted SAM-dependent methyltransferase